MRLNSIYPVVLCSAAASAHAVSVEQLFGPHLSPNAKIIDRSSSNWTEEVQQRWSTWAAPKYRAAIKIATVKDIQKSVKIAAAHNIPFLATAAGHGTAATYGNLHHGIDIDISSLQYAKFDPKTDLLTIGGATKFQQMWDALQPHGKEIPTGAAQCVGALGATLGAGIGPLQGHRGLMLDSLKSVKMVIANGSLINVSKTEHPDLFWGLRGAGFNFGIVTEAVYNVFDATFGGHVNEGDMLFPGSVNGSLWKILKSFDHSLDPKLSLVPALSFDRDSDEPVIVLNTVYYGPKKKMMNYIKPFLDLKPLTSNFTLVPWNKLYASLFFGQDTTSCNTNQQLNVGGIGLRHIDVGAFEKFVSDFATFSRKHPTVNGSFVASRFSSHAPLSVPDDEAVYPYRDIKTHLLFEFIYPNASLNKAVDNFLFEARKTFVPTSGYKNLTLYQNYNHGDEGPEVWYSEAKLKRLSKLKRKWDPKELFSFNCPVPLHFP